MKQLRASKWEFVTSNGGGISIGMGAGEGGSITLKEPQARKDVKFYYGALGAGLSWGVKIPKLGKVHVPGVSGSSESFPSYGTLYLTPSFARSELTVADVDLRAFSDSPQPRVRPDVLYLHRSVELFRANSPNTAA
ncbi:MAG: hypothetical protein RL701_4189 [Pseudomonadota bacterium]|jgi:hypothetical protein